MALKFMYITNDLQIALLAEKYGVNRIWIDLETGGGKAERQYNMNTVKSDHKISDIKIITPLLTKSEMLVRVNPWYDKSVDEITAVIDAGAELVMLPMWKRPDEVEMFIKAVNGKAKTVLLLETKEAEQCLDDVLKLDGIDEIHIGLNDLHLSYGMTFMFELLADGTVERIISKIKPTGIPFGFGGIAKIGDGLLPAEKIILEHYRLGSTRVILSRTFLDNALVQDISEIERVFQVNTKAIRDFEVQIMQMSQEDFEKNRKEVVECVKKVVIAIKEKKNAGH